MTEEGTDGQTEGENEEKVREATKEHEKLRENTSHIRQHPRKSLMELLVMSAPLFHVTSVLYAGFNYVNPDMPSLLISTFPKESRNFFAYFLCIAWETYMIHILCAWVTYVIFAIMSFVLTLTDIVDLVMRRISVR